MTMRVLVVYESVMGNTRQVAEAVAAGVRDAAPRACVRCVPAARILAEPADADLVVAGGPTHFLGLPAERTRRLWVDGVLRQDRRAGGPIRLEPWATGPGLREWFAQLGQPGEGDPELRAGAAGTGGAPPAAAFDTRLDRPMAGSAARRIAHLLRRHGFRLIDRPEGFVVEDLHGPLRAGERERAEAWGARLAAEAGLRVG
ncbi:MAG TPA: hypothetical protein VI248_18740 [Kineosporiaceae bacterium]